MNDTVGTGRPVAAVDRIPALRRSHLHRYTTRMGQRTRESEEYDKGDTWSGCTLKVNVIIPTNQTTNCAVCWVLGCKCIIVNENTDL